MFQFANLRIELVLKYNSFDFRLSSEHRRHVSSNSESITIIEMKYTHTLKESAVLLFSHIHKLTPTHTCAKRQNFDNGENEIGAIQVPGRIITQFLWFELMVFRLKIL